MSRPFSGRPSSARPKRPSSARTTSTKTYFDRRDGVKDEDDPPSPFDTNAKTNEAFLSLLRNTDADFRQGLIKTEKPRVEIVEPVIDTSENSPILVPEQTARNIIQYFWGLILSAVVQIFDTIKRREGVLNEEDGFISRGSNKKSIQTSRMEDRIRRELEKVQNTSSREREPCEPRSRQSLACLPHDGEGMDTSFWTGQDKRGANIELAISLEEVRFKHHPQFTEEERAASETTNLYKLYRERIDADTIKHLIKRLLSICDFADNNAMLRRNIREIVDTSEKLLEESSCIRNMQVRLEKLWIAVLRAREQSGFVSTDVELETTEATVGNDFESKVQVLIDKISSLRSEVSDPSLQALHDVLTTDFEQHNRTLKLSRSKNVSQLGRIPKEEKLRRRRISSEKYFVRLLIDGNPVGDTRRVKMQWSTFNINLSHCFQCKLSEQPNECCLQIFMAPTGFLPSHLVSSVFISIPRLDEARLSRERTSSVSSTSYEFANHAELKGTILVSTAIEAIPADETSNTVKVPRRPTSSRLLSANKTTQYSQKKHSLQSDIEGLARNRQAMMAFKCGNKTLISSSFREPPRHILLRKRQANPNIPSPIPNTDFEIPTDIYSAYLEQDNEEVQEEIIDDALRERSSVNRANATCFFKTVIEYSLLQDYQRVKVKKQYAELIKDVGLFRFSGEGDFNLPIIPRKRSFAPSTSSILRYRPKNFSHQNSLLFSVVLGKNLPTRIDNISAVDVNPDEINLGFIVKVQLRGKSYRTRAIKCQTQMTPFWNETITIPLDWISDHGDFSALEKESIVVSVFDCVDIDVRSHGGFYEDEDTKMLNYLFMGSVTIPLATVLRIDGFVRCTTPDYIVGYTNQPSALLPGNFEDGKAQDSTRPAQLMLRVHATTDPIVTIPTKSIPDFPSNESAEVLSRVKQWSERYLEGTNSTVLWPNTHGCCYLASRFLTAQNPPNIRTMTIEACAHYVSLIPLKRTWRSLERLNMSQHLVLTTTQTLDIQAGDATEHAVLLANYFLYLSKKNPVEYNAHVYLVPGFSIQEGRTVWVMRKSSSGDVLFWEATSGCSFSSDDDSIPLQKIYCLVSKENIYANLHQETRPHSLDFDLTNPKQWAPLHNTDDQLSIDDIASIQEETLAYSPPNHSYARDLQDELKENIKSAMREWRRTTTSFRTDILSKLVSILERLEQAKLGGKDSKVVPLEVSSKTKTVAGFALHFSFTNSEDILSAIKSNEIHNNRNPHVEFSLGIRVFAYPGGVMSVWVFLCTVTPKA